MKHTRFVMPVEVVFRAIRSTWTLKEELQSGERCLVPTVGRLLSPVADPDALRQRFFRMNLDEDSATRFLNEVGVWNAVEDKHVSVSDNALMSGGFSVGLPGMVLTGGYGHRFISGRASIETLDSLKRERDHWHELTRNRTKLRAAFRVQPGRSAAPYKLDQYALETAFGNTLKVHLEWRGKSPHAIIEALTGREMLMALAWVDLIEGRLCKICHNENCPSPEYTHKRRKFCSYECEHATTTRNHRKRKRDA